MIKTLKEAFDILDKINEAIEDPVKQEAANNFRKALNATYDVRTRQTKRNGYIDLENFHKAYDDEINELGIYDNLFGADGKLKSRSVYGTIKNIDKVAHPDLVKDLGNLWGAQFSDFIGTQAENKAKEDERIRREEEARLAKEKEEADKQFNLDEHKKMIDEITNRLNADADIKALLDKIRNSVIENADDIAKLTIDSFSSYDGRTIYDNLFVGKAALTNIKNPIEFQFKYDIANNKSVDEYFNEIKTRLLKEVYKFNEAIEQAMRPALVKRITAKDEKEFGESFDLALVDKSGNKYALYAAPAGRGYSGEGKIADGLFFTDLNNKAIDIPNELPLEIIAISYKGLFEHNTHSIYGYSGTNSTICFTNKADDAVYKYFGYGKEGDKYYSIYAKDDNFLTSRTTRTEYNEEVNGTVYPVVIHSSVTHYND